jgi:hypothetical protein
MGDELGEVVVMNLFGETMCGSDENILQKTLFVWS